jgi:hypothetical protein
MERTPYEVQKVTKSPTTAWDSPGHYRLSHEGKAVMRAVGPVDDLILWLTAGVLLLLWFYAAAVSLGSFPGRTAAGPTTCQAACPSGPDQIAATAK